MFEKPLNIESALRAAFLKSELEYLKTIPRFLAVSENAKTPSDFMRLCEVAEELLKQHHCAHPVAQQLRSSLNPDRKAGRSSPA